jgi:hypothetical protein
MIRSVLLSVLILASASSSGFAQKKKCRNRFDTTLAKKHEISVTLGIINGGTSYDFVVPYGRGTVMGIEYARVYKHNHFLRGGMRGGVQGTNIGDDRKFTLQPSPEFWWGFVPSDTVLFLTNTSQNIGRYWGSGFIGYEYGIGKKSLRFTFGADLHPGYQLVDVRTAQKKYRQNAPTMRGRICSTTLFSF